MNIRVLYFASLREAVGTAHEQVSVPADVRTVAQLRELLGSRGGDWEALSRNSLRVALNQQMAGPESVLHEGDEVAFFPPVTGG